MTTTQQVLDTTRPLFQVAGSAFYFTPETLSQGKELGLDGFRFYFLGRGGVLGDVEAPVVTSAFGYFEPGLVAHMWDTAREKVAPRAAGHAHLECAHDMGRARLADLSDLDDFCAAAAAVVAAAEPAGLALFAGMLGEPVPEDGPARAMHHVVLLREHRGSAHLLAVVASGLSPKTAHYLKRPGDFTLFGWKEEDVPAIDDEDRRRHLDAEALTDRLLAPAYDVLDEAGRAALVTGAQAVADALGAQGAVVPRR